MTAKKDYQSEALRLSRAIDIAITAFKTHPPKNFPQADIDYVLGVFDRSKELALNPKAPFRRLASLKYIIEEVFSYFQEASGKTVEYFWNEIDREKLGYVREDKLRKILDRGKIRGRIEYEYAVDTIVAAEQTGRMTEDEAKKLSAYIGDFEFKSKSIKR